MSQLQHQDARSWRQRCKVPSCTANMADEPGYFRSRRVCKLHMYSQEVMFNGIPSRWCQQCTKFQAVTLFNEDQRSCQRGLGEKRKRDVARAAAAAHDQNMSDADAPHIPRHAVPHPVLRHASSNAPSPTGPYVPSATGPYVPSPTGTYVPSATGPDVARQVGTLCHQNQHLTQLPYKSTCPADHKRPHDGSTAPTAAPSGTKKQHPRAQELDSKTNNTGDAAPGLAAQRLVLPFDIALQLLHWLQHHGNRLQLPAGAIAAATAKLQSHVGQLLSAPSTMDATRTNEQQDIGIHGHMDTTHHVAPDAPSWADVLPNHQPHTLCNPKMDSTVIRSTDQARTDHYITSTDTPPDASPLEAPTLELDSNNQITAALVDHQLALPARPSDPNQLLDWLYHIRNSPQLAAITTGFAPQLPPSHLCTQHVPFVPSTLDEVITLIKANQVRQDTGCLVQQQEITPK